MTANSRGERTTTVGIPGTGIFFRKTDKPAKAADATKQSEGVGVCGCLCGCLALGAVLLLCGGLLNTTFSPPLAQETAEPARTFKGREAPSSPAVEAPELAMIDDESKTRVADSKIEEPSEVSVTDVSPAEVSLPTGGFREVRTWVDDTRKFSVDGQFKEFHDQIVVLTKTDGTDVRVPFTRLSEEDKDYVRKVTHQDIPNVLEGHVTGVLAANRITVKRQDGRSENVLLDGVKAKSRETRKALTRLIFDKDVKVMWFDRTASGWMVGDVYHGEEHINENVALALTEENQQEKDSTANARRQIHEQFAKKRRARAAVDQERAEYLARPSAASSGRVWVNGYRRKDGTYVRGHWRSRPSR